MEEPQESSQMLLSLSSKIAGPESTSSGRVKPGLSSVTGRRRKVPDSVTPNACTNCKKARAKVRGENGTRFPPFADLCIVRRSQAGLQTM
jgi:hypothetical protein